MLGKTLKIVAVALLMIGAVASTGAVHRSKQPLRVAVCCGAPPPACPGSPNCPGFK